MRRCKGTKSWDLGQNSSHFRKYPPPSSAIDVGLRFAVCGDHGVGTLCALLSILNQGDGIWEGKRRTRDGKMAKSLLDAQPTSPCRKGRKRKKRSFRRRQVMIHPQADPGWGENRRCRYLLTMIGRLKITLALCFSRLRLNLCPSSQLPSPEALIPAPSP